MTDLSGKPRVTQVTPNTSIIGLGGTLRFASDNATLLLAQSYAVGEPPLFETISMIRRINVATGAIELMKNNILGEVGAVSRSSGFALVIRHKALTNGFYDNQLVRMPLVGTGPEQLLVDGGDLSEARLTADDAAIVLRRGSTAFSTLGATGGSETGLRGSGAEQISADVGPKR
jgi:hypothetical protein